MIDWNQDRPPLAAADSLVELRQPDGTVFTGRLVAYGYYEMGEREKLPLWRVTAASGESLLYVDQPWRPVE
jgi:hypothetical protein